MNSMKKTCQCESWDHNETNRIKHAVGKYRYTTTSKSRKKVKSSLVSNAVKRPHQTDLRMITNECEFLIHGAKKKGTPLEIA